MSHLSPFLPHLAPLWPLLAVVAAAGAITLLTWATYRGVDAGKGRHRWPLLLGLRLLALFVAVLVLLRPGWEYRDVQRTPATLTVLIDATKSMAVMDEDPSRTRWEAAVKDYQAAQDLIQKLEKEYQVRVEVFQFDSKLHPLTADKEPAGDRTGIFQALSQAFDDRDRGTQQLGIILLSDGRDNVGKPAMEAVVAKLSRAPCPVHAIGLGNPGGSELQPDVIARAIEAPQTARVKDRLVVRGQLQAQRFVNQPIEVWLLIDGKPVPEADNPSQNVKVTVTPQEASQTIALEFPPAKLPDTPGDIRLSAKALPLPGELTASNNEVATYVTLIKEGLSVLYIDKLRAWEPKYLKQALKGDERITVYPAIPPAPDGSPEADAWRRDLRENLTRTSYDVFVLGDVPASRFGPNTRDGEAILELIRAKVNQGAGLVMIGGHESFGDGGWGRTPLATVLPVELNVTGQLEGAAGRQREIRFVPTADGLRHFALLLSSDRAQQLAWWERLPRLNGGNRLGNRKANAAVLAQTAEGEPLLVAGQYGRGRTAALAVDTTWRWARPGAPADPRDATKPGALSEGREAHLRFWRQLILWLAQQEQTGQAVRIELAHRRLAAGKENVVTVQAREVTPGGSKDQQKPLPGAEFTVKVIKPGGAADPLVVRSDGGADGKAAGTFWKTDEPGEYEVEVTARYQGKDLGVAKARFMTYRDDSELLNRTADHALLAELARATGGTFRLHGGLRELLDELTTAGPPTERVQVLKIPNWDEPNDAFQLALFVAFVGLISGEWLLRRLWGLV